MPVRLIQHTLFPRTFRSNEVRVGERGARGIGEAGGGARDDSQRGPANEDQHRRHPGKAWRPRESGSQAFLLSYCNFIFIIIGRIAKKVKYMVTYKPLVVEIHTKMLVGRQKAGSSTFKCRPFCLPLKISNI